METVPHGIGVQNRYALFYDEDVDPLEILRQQEEEKQKRKTEKTMCKDKTKITKSKVPASVPSQKKTIESASVKTSKSTEITESVTKPKPKGPTDRFQRSYGSNQDSKDFEDRKNTRNREDQYFSTESKERDPEFRRGRGGARGRGGRDRGRGFYGNAETRNRRMFERHSGSDKTGVRPVEKRDGAGSNNWGDIRSDISRGKEEALWEEEFDGDKTRDSTNWVDDEIAEKKEDLKNEIEATDTKENDPVPEEPIEEAVKEMTLDEWKREQEAKRVVPKYNLRKPGEGEDDKQWKKSYMLKKKAKEEDEDQDDEEEEDDEEYNRKGNQRLLLDIQINFSDSRRGMRGRGRGGRGAPRAAGREPVQERGNRGGGGGRAGNRESAKGKGQQSAPRVDDFNDFPSLANA